MVITQIGVVEKQSNEFCHQKTYRNIKIFAEKMRLIVNVSCWVYSVNSHRVNGNENTSYASFFSQGCSEA